MKRKLFCTILSMMIFLTSAIPSFATSKLNRPAIDDISRYSQDIYLSWNEINHADAYKVYRSKSADSGYKVIATCYSAHYYDEGLSKGYRYYYKVKAISFSDSYENSRLSKWRSRKIPSPKATVSQTVYITATGSKYHRYGCQYLWNSCYSISKSSAQAQGYTACSRCW